MTLLRASQLRRADNFIFLHIISIKSIFYFYSLFRRALGKQKVEVKLVILVQSPRGDRAISIALLKLAQSSIHESATLIL
jgi:hypothetical protein